MRWLMTLGERSCPDTPTYAECPGPKEARALALVDDCGQLFPILLAWRRIFGCDLTGWAGQVEADDIENLPQDVTADWGPGLRLDTMPGGYVKVSDYRDHEPPTALTAAPPDAHALSAAAEKPQVRGGFAPTQIKLLWMLGGSPSPLTAPSRTQDRPRGRDA